jgi:hypothetical protein
MARWDNWVSNITTTPITGYGTVHNATTYTVARCCAICTRLDGTMEISPDGVIQKADFWICPDCCRKIGEVIRNIV